MNMLSKVLRLQEAAFTASSMRALVFKVTLFTSKQYAGEI